MRQEKVAFRSGALLLEGRLVVPARGGAIPGVILCHPHPLYGGSMENNVIHAVARGLAEEGIASLRFNFRGVGQSEGTYDDGRGEVDDALAAVSFLAGLEEVSCAGVGMMGYSFGGTVALKAGMRDDTVKAVAAVSPVEIPDLGGPKPRLVVCGAADSLVPAAGALREKERIIGGGAGSIELVEGADHFWSGCEGVMAGLVCSFFVRHLAG